MVSARGGRTLFFGSLALLMVARELEKLWDRVEQLEVGREHSPAGSEQRLQSAPAE
jgi:hypothetical protein